MLIVDFDLFYAQWQHLKYYCDDNNNINIV